MCVLEDVCASVGEHVHAPGMCVRGYVKNENLFVPSGCIAADCVDNDSVDLCAMSCAANTSHRMSASTATVAGALERCCCCCCCREGWGWESVDREEYGGCEVGGIDAATAVAVAVPVVVAAAVAVAVALAVVSW